MDLLLADLSVVIINDVIVILSTAVNILLLICTFISSSDSHSGSCAIYVANDPSIGCSDNPLIPQHHSPSHVTAPSDVVT